MKKSTYILLTFGLIIGSAVMGFMDGGDMTAAVILAILLLPGIFDNRKAEKDVK